MKVKNVFQLSLLLLSVTVFSCKNAEENSTQSKKDVPESSQEKNSITLEKLEGSTSYPGASLKLLEPETSEVNDTSLNFNFEVQDYELGKQTDSPLASKLANSEKGQHIHFIVDNDPYAAHYEPQFQKDFSEGTHNIVAFLSRSYHESVKNMNSFVAKTFQIGTEKDAGDKVDLSKPTLIYSRPKGEYSGKDTNNLLLDFFLLNTELSENGNKVKATINDTEFILSEWVPYVINGLPKGKVKIRLQLLDVQGNVVDGAYNDVTREITLSE
ncbi:hypothetical protein [Autumnicola musiva]|uniref:Lipoprotein n=1 Tax=Autumnicola musiva TaxID=3075589 RepID=A0ABU3DB65_9FLAO|nr:hypothetical protein [Zunongwangia sp. F117]MDT0678711.1 hypothetical protein [Zunongwangia sp. F117]